MKNDNNVTILNLALCEGRHSIPQATDGAIFGNEIAPSMIVNPQLLEDKAFSILWGMCNKLGICVPSEEEEYSLIIPSNLHINLYVTGLTVALISVLNMCHTENISVTLWHFDRESGEYFPQSVK